ncbi:MAG: archease [Methanobacteriota archaeon]|nr:MAG: archease [Euryarchaeota archaeon]
MTFRELEHTADVRVRIEAPTLAALFEEAGTALFTIMYGTCTPQSIERRVSIASGDLESLLADYLSELLYLSEAEGIVFCSFQVAVSGTSLEATARGEPLDPSKHAGREVKGISYSDLAIKPTAEGYAAEIIFDI